MIQRCGHQLRTALQADERQMRTGIVGIDLPAWLQTAAILGYDQQVILWMIPPIENAIIQTLNHPSDHG